MTRSSIDTATAQRAIDAKTKPLGALGQLEDIAVRLAVFQGTLSPRIGRARVCVFGADHGVASEGVSAYPREVTAEMMRNFDRGGAAINVIAATNDVSVDVIDVGVDADLSTLARVRQDKVRRGSRNILVERAMTAEELAAALAVGERAAQRAAADGVDALGLGEMGIGNTTVAAALLSALTGQRSAVTVGRGTGVNEDGLARKRTVVDRACDLHAPSTGGQLPTLELLRRLGGLELAAIAGAAIEAARLGIVVVADGFISTVAILAATRIAEQSSAAEADALIRAIFIGHRSSEAGHALALEHYARLANSDARPILQLGMRLGEGSGAALAMPVLRSAAAVMSDMATFEAAGVSAGDHAEAHSVG